MLKSLYSGVSGMRGFQTKMDVIANNIANVNTTAFKASRISFRDMISQTTANASGPSTNGLGGINARQVGLGVKVGSIDMMMGGGALQPTNRELDFAIENEGFFAVSGNVNIDDGTVGTISYTRDGAFFRDHEGNLVNASGQKVLGYAEEDPVEIVDGTESVVPDPPELDSLVALVIPNNLDPDDPDSAELQSFSVDTSGRIIGIYSDGTTATKYLIGQVALVKFSNPEGLTKAGGNSYNASNNSGLAEVGVAGTAGYGAINQGFLEMSNVDLANEFTEMIIASKAYSANSRSISTSDEMLQELINLKR